LNRRLPDTSPRPVPPPVVPEDLAVADAFVRASAPLASTQLDPESVIQEHLEEPIGIGPRGTMKVSDMGPRGYRAGGRKAAADVAEVVPVRMTAYVRPEQLKALRFEVVRRQSRGIRADLSAVVREALDRYLASK
jgi:hypothetical protein